MTLRSNMNSDSNCGNRVLRVPLIASMNCVSLLQLQLTTVVISGQTTITNFRLFLEHQHTPVSLFHLRQYLSLLFVPTPAPPSILLLPPGEVHLTGCKPLHYMNLSSQ